MADDKLIRDVLELLLTIDRKLQRIEEKIDDLLGEDQYENNKNKHIGAPIIKNYGW